MFLFIIPGIVNISFFIGFVSIPMLYFPNALTELCMSTTHFVPMLEHSCHLSVSPSPLAAFLQPLCPPAPSWLE